jgi:hypothetical protein
MYTKYKIKIDEKDNRRKVERKTSISTYKASSIDSLTAKRRSSVSESISSISSVTDLIPFSRSVFMAGMASSTRTSLCDARKDEPESSPETEQAKS